MKEEYKEIFGEETVGAKMQYEKLLNHTRRKYKLLHFYVYVFSMFFSGPITILFEDILGLYHGQIFTETVGSFFYIGLVSIVFNIFLTSLEK